MDSKKKCLNCILITKSKRKVSIEQEKIEICEFCSFNKNIQIKFKNELNEKLIPQILKIFEDKILEFEEKNETTINESQIFFEKIQENLFSFERNFLKLKKENITLLNFFEKEINFKQELIKKIENLEEELMLLNPENIKFVHQFLKKNEKNIDSFLYSFNWLDHYKKNIENEMK